MYVKVANPIEPEELMKKFVELSEKYAELLKEHDRMMAELCEERARFNR